MTAPIPKPLPCPFCGGTPVVDYYGGTDGPTSPCTVSCIECGCDLTASGKGEAVRRWNRRAKA